MPGGGHMVHFERQTFAGGQVQLDSNTFKNCNFRQVELLYSGLSYPEIVNCVFDACRWRFQGPAEQTIALLADLHGAFGGGGRQAVEEIFDNIRRGGELQSDRLAVAVATFKPRIFIGHGHSNDYLILSDFLRSEMFEVVTFESEQRPGFSTKEILESMLASASIAFLVHTAEDEQAGKRTRARQNIVHETGLF